MTPPKARRLRWYLRRLSLLALLTGLPLLGMHQYVLAQSRGRIFSPGDAPERPVAIVLGARVWSDGSPSYLLLCRLRAAAELYQSGKVQHVLVSGDNGQLTYNEVQVMADTLVELGVPRQRVVLDHAGFRTLDSMLRAKKVFGVERAIVVSNAFHVPRAVFLGRAIGLDVVGVAAGDYGQSPGPRTRFRNACREAVARVLAFVDVKLIDRQPRFLGPRVQIGSAQEAPTLER